MDNNLNRKCFQNNAKKKQNALKSVYSYLGQLKLHFELSDNEMCDIIKIVAKDYKKSISSKRWWQIFN